MISIAYPTLDVIPAQAGIHLEIAAQPQGGSAVFCDLAARLNISGWTPAFAGVTSRGWDLEWIP